MLLLLLLACGTKAPQDTATTPVTPVPWSGSQARTHTDLATIRGLIPRRGIVHLHSPWSHDACDGEPLVDGEPDAACLADLREALCTTGMDFAYVTDHPSHAADQDFEDLLHAQSGDEVLTADGQVTGNRIPCPDGSAVVWMPGIEDTLMPLGLHAHAGAAPEDRHATYDSASAEAIGAEQAAGAIVFTAHTEGKDLATLEQWVNDGLQGVEIFNLHAMFDPTKRREDLGLDPMGWATDIAPFTGRDGTAEPDLFFLAVLEEQTVSVQRWDALQALGPVVGVAGTDAHQNVLPVPLRDGERGDSYRRMLRWFSNHLLISADSPGPADFDEALAAGRAYTAFELLGTPTGFDFHHRDSQDAITEMGGDTTSGALILRCPVLSASSPKNRDAPEINALIFKDGQPWAKGCGEFNTDGPGAYRVRIDITPHHLRDFLGDEPDGWIHSYPWIYSNPIRVR